MARKRKKRFDLHAHFDRWEFLVFKILAAAGILIWLVRALAHEASSR